MINRRQLMKLGTGACAASFIPPAQSIELPRPQRAVFIFIPMGSIQSGWQPEACGTLANSGELLAPFAPIAERCLVPKETFLTRGGFGQTQALLSPAWYAEGSNSLDVAIGNYLNAQQQTSSPHLHLCAAEGEIGSNTLGVGTSDGKRIHYEHEPEQLLNRLQAYGLPDGFNVEEFARFDSAIDSQSTWRVKRYLSLAKTALQTGFSQTITLMLGDDEAQLQAPPSLDLSIYMTLRGYGPTARVQDFIKFKAYLHQLVAQFIQDLASTDDSQGQSLLDSTMVYLFSNMGNGSDYTLYNTPILLAGADNTFRTGEIFNQRASNDSILNAIGLAFMGEQGVLFDDDIAFNLLR